MIEYLKDYGIDILFSTEGTAPSPERLKFLDGDLLSVYYSSISSFRYPIVDKGFLWAILIISLLSPSV